MLSVLAVSWLVFAVVGCVDGAIGISVGSSRPKTLVVAFDGLGQQYFDGKRFLPWFSQFRQTGVFSDSVRSVFPTETFPNFYSVATGLYPESHGVVGNRMYDPATARHFFMNVTDPIWWSGAEPLWVTVRRLGLAKTATSAWPGGDVRVRPSDLTANYMFPYDLNVPFRKRVDDMIDLMANQGVDLGFLYHYQPDSIAHSRGNNGSMIANELMRTDWLLSYLLLATERAGLGPKKLNIIICADHGMTDVVREVYLDDFINVGNKIESFSRTGAFASIWPKPGQEEAVYGFLKQAAGRSNGVWTVYRKKELPARFHYQKNVRISPITITSKLGTYIALTRSERSQFVGIHGYDPELLEMRPSFMARGPSFKRDGYNASLDTAGMETKDIYALIAKLIGLEKQRQPLNNASLRFFTGMLSAASSLKSNCLFFTVAAFMPVISVLLSTASNYYYY